MATEQRSPEFSSAASENKKSTKYMYSSKANVRLYVLDRHAVLEIDESHERAVACLFPPDLARRLSVTLLEAANEIEQRQLANKQLGCD